MKFSIPMTKVTNYFGLALSALLLCGCAAVNPPPLNKTNLVPHGPECVYHPTGKSIALGAFEGPRGKGNQVYLITVYDLKTALTEGLKNSQLFTSVGQETEKNADYSLTAKMRGQSSKGVFTITVESIVDYEIKRNRTGEVVFSKRITGKQSVSTGKAFVGVTRARLAVEGATRDNVKQLLEAISKLQF